MNKQINFILITMLLLFLGGAVFAKENAKHRGKAGFYKGNQDRHVETASNIANWSYYVRHDGRSAHTPLGNDGGVYPRGTTHTIFQDGFIWGGFVNNDTRDPDLPKLRVGGQTYVVGTNPGWIETPGTASTDPVGVDANDPRVAMYRIRIDFETLEIGDPSLIADAASINEVPVGDVTEKMQQDILDQYRIDWDNWPWELGAPFYDVNGNGQLDRGVEQDLNGDGEIAVGEREEPGIAGADQVVWYVVNDLDAGATANLYGSPPIGLEIQNTLWAYNQPEGTLGQLIFKSYLIINKSGFVIDSMFVSQWSDPDVGQFTDDLVASDVPRSLGIAYTGFLTDPSYDAFGLPPAAAGYDFFQGPIVPSPGDTANFRLGKRPGYRNLPMTSFGYFAAGSPIDDPELSSYDGTLEWYNLLNGFTTTSDTANPVPFRVGSGPNTGQPTKFPVSGDVISQAGDVDALGVNLPPGDRRMSLASGPITMQPGDSQEVVVAVVGGIIAQTGGNNRNAVAQVQLNDDFAQFIFDNAFQGIPRPPSPPRPTWYQEETNIVLDWGHNYNAVGESEKRDPLLGFHFEGYNVYQLPSANATRDQAIKIATYDLNNNITQINALKFLPEFGALVSVPIQLGTNTGVFRFHTLSTDAFTGGPLFPGNRYYFAVTAYNAKDSDGDGIVDTDVPEAALESSLNIIEIIPQAARPGERFFGEIGEVIEPEHEGNADATIFARVVDPTKFADATYDIVFDSDTTVIDDTTFTVSNSWSLLQNGTVVDDPQFKGAFDKNTSLNNLDDDVNNPLINGLQVKVGNFGFDAPSTFLDVELEQGDNLSFWGDATLFGAATGFYAEFGNGVPFPAPAGLAQWDLEFRFTGVPDPDQAAMHPDSLEFLNDLPITEGGQWSTQWDRASFGAADLSGSANVQLRVPFELWDVENNMQIKFAVINRNADGASPYGDGVGDPNTAGMEPRYRMSGRDYVVVIYEPYDEATAETELFLHNDANSTWLLFFEQGGASLWETGDVIRVTYGNPVIPGSDVYRFSTQAATRDSRDLARAAVENINVFPNPYYGFNPEETNRFQRFVTFSNMPESFTMRIFALNGTQVRKLTESDKTSVASQFLQWDLRNEANLPVASGIYFVHIDMPALNMEKVLKVFIIQREEVLDFF